MVSLQINAAAAAACDAYLQSSTVQQLHDDLPSNCAAFAFYILSHLSPCIATHLKWNSVCEECVNTWRISRHLGVTQLCLCFECECREI